MARHGADLLPEVGSGLRGPAADFLTHLSIEKGASSNTVDAYARDIGRYLSFLDAAGISELRDSTEATVRGFIESLEELGLAVRSRARATVALRRLHGFAAAESGSHDDPTAGITPPNDTLRLPKALSISQVEALIATTAGSEPAQLRAAALLEFLYASGARISEAVSLDIDDVDTTAGISRLYGKGNKERLVPLGSMACAALDAWLVRGRPSMSVRGGRASAAAVFVNARGGRLTRQSVWAIVKEAAQKANVSGVTAHSLRHSCATHLLEGGANIRMVQELLGHSSVTTTQIYTMVTADALREVYATTHPRAR